MLDSANGGVTSPSLGTPYCGAVSSVVHTRLMQSPAFSQNVRRLNVDDPKRNQALTEIERSLARLLKKYSHGWEADVVVDVRGMLERGKKDAAHQSEQE